MTPVGPLEMIGTNNFVLVELGIVFVLGVALGALRHELRRYRQQRRNTGR